MQPIVLEFAWLTERQARLRHKPQPRNTCGEKGQARCFTRFPVVGMGADRVEAPRAPHIIFGLPQQLACSSSTRKTSTDSAPPLRATGTQPKSDSRSTQLRPSDPTKGANSHDREGLE